MWKRWRQQPRQLPRGCEVALCLRRLVPAPPQRPRPRLLSVPYCRPSPACEQHSLPLTTGGGDKLFRSRPEAPLPIDRRNHLQGPHDRPGFLAHFPRRRSLSRQLALPSLVHDQREFHHHLPRSSPTQEASGRWLIARYDGVGPFYVPQGTRAAREAGQQVRRHRANLHTPVAERGFQERLVFGREVFLERLQHRGPRIGLLLPPRFGEPRATQRRILPAHAAQHGCSLLQIPFIPDVPKVSLIAHRPGPLRIEPGEPASPLPQHGDAQLLHYVHGTGEQRVWQTESGEPQPFEGFEEYGRSLVHEESTQELRCFRGAG